MYSNGMLMVVLVSFAVWRLVYMVQEESGPRAIFARFRAWVATNMSTKYGSFYDGLTCFKCSSVWVAGLVSLVLYNDTVITWVVYTFAISAFAIAIDAAYSKWGK